MSVHTIKVFLKISTLTIIILIGLITVDNVFLDKQVIADENKYTFKSADSSDLWRVGVAISTNVWIWFTKRQTTPIKSYQDVPKLETIIWNPDLVVWDIIDANMLIIKEYLNLLRVDVLDLLDNSIDREEALDDLISQLELRYKDWASNISILQSYTVTLSNTMTSTDSQVETLKTKISADSKNFDSDSSIENIETYTNLKQEYYKNKIILVFVSNFIRQYSYLNAYNKNLLDTLINNKEAIVNKSKVIIPDSGSKLVEELKLIYDEAEWKNEQLKEGIEE